MAPKAVGMRRGVVKKRRGSVFSNGILRYSYEVNRRRRTLLFFLGLFFARPGRDVVLQW